MQSQTYEGYFEKGLFYSEGKVITIPERRDVFLTIFESHQYQPHDNVSNEEQEVISRRLKELDAIIQAIESAADEEMPIFEPIRLREVDL